MYKAEDEKEPNFTKMTICSACLSTSRLLFPLGAFTDIYQKFCEVSNKCLLSEMYFCWECVAMLKKIKLFKEKVAVAQKLFNCRSLDLKITGSKCLSNLKIANIEADDTIIIEHEDILEDIKPTVTIKEETEYLSNDYDTFNYEDDYIHLEDLKSENNEVVQQISKLANCTKQRTQKYRMIINPNNNAGPKRIRIAHHEVNGWLEREKNSVFFTNLTNKCEICISKLRSKDGLYRHTRKFHSESKRRFCCDICHTWLATKRCLTAHVASHYYVHQCNICGYQCYTKEHMRYHMTTHKKTVQCLDCNACYNNVRLFFTHYKSMHCIYLCDHCNKRCTSKHILEKHIQKRHSQHVCKTCDQSFKTYENLRRHTELKHVTARTEDAFCVKCDKQFSNVLMFKRHVTRSVAHASERSGLIIKREKVPCPECENVYSRKTYMLNHYRLVHRNESKFYCTDCDKYFLNRTRYTDHRRYTHEGYVKEKNKLCNVCGRGFAANRTLVNHMRTHSGERPYVCPYCESKFTQKQAMLSHVKFIHLKGRRKVSSYV